MATSDHGTQAINDDLYDITGEITLLHYFSDKPPTDSERNGMRPDSFQTTYHCREQPDPTAPPRP